MLSRLFKKLEKGLVVFVDVITISLDFIIMINITVRGIQENVLIAVLVIHKTHSITFTALYRLGQVTGLH